MIDRRPGLNPERLVGLMRAAIGRCNLDLTGLTIFTEAASGPYVVTPVIAAMAGARRVMAVTRSSRYGTFEEVRGTTLDLARHAGVADCIDVVPAATDFRIRQADIVTNSGHVRPIDRVMIGWMKRGAVIPLMYESWEFRPDDLDLEACRRAGVLVGGTTERHPRIDVFSYLGPLAVRLLHDAGVAVYGSSILLLCDNPFAPYLEQGLRAAGATVESTPAVAAACGDAFDAVLVSLTPGPAVRLSADDAGVIARRWPGSVVAQFWGDLDRTALQHANVPVWPASPPHPGHMGILLSTLGPESVVRLQTGGLKAAQVLLQHRTSAGDLELVDPMPAAEAAA